MAPKGAKTAIKQGKRKTIEKFVNGQVVKPCKVYGLYGKSKVYCKNGSGALMQDDSGANVLYKDAATSA